MSKVLKTAKEYLQVVRAGIQNSDKIVEAMWIATQVKNGNASEEAVAEIMRRKEICAMCPQNSENARKDGTYNSSLPYTHCILCLCRLGEGDSKEYCLSCTCGRQSWNERHPNHPMEVMWHAFDIDKNKSTTEQ